MFKQALLLDLLRGFCWLSFLSISNCVFALFGGHRLCWRILALGSRGSVVLGSRSRLVSLVAQSCWLLVLRWLVEDRFGRSFGGWLFGWLRLLFGSWSNGGGFDLFVDRLCGYFWSQFSGWLGSFGSHRLLWINQMLFLQISFSSCLKWSKI